MSVIIDDIDMVKNDNDIFDPNNDMETMFLLSQWSKHYQITLAIKRMTMKSRNELIKTAK